MILLLIQNDLSDYASEWVTSLQVKQQLRTAIEAICLNSTWKDAKLCVNWRKPFNELAEIAFINQGVPKVPNFEPLVSELYGIFSINNLNISNSINSARASSLGQSYGPRTTSDHTFFPMNKYLRAFGSYSVLSFQPPNKIEFLFSGKLFELMFALQSLTQRFTIFRIYENHWPASLSIMRAIL